MNAVKEGTLKIEDVLVVGGTEATETIKGLDGMFMDNRRFTQIIEDCVMNTELSYIDAIVHICESGNMEVEDVRKFLSGSILLQLEAEARALNYLPKVNVLDV
jgi:hypothetical protein